MREENSSENLPSASCRRVINQTRVTRRLTSTLLPPSGHLTMGEASSPLTLSSVKGESLAA